MLDLLRRDPTVRALPRWILVAPLTASVMEGIRTLLVGVRTWRGGGGFLAEPAGDLVMLTLVIWLPLAIYVAFGKTGERCTLMDLGLPVAAPKLWLSHMAGIVLSGVAVLAGAASVAALRDVAVRSLSEGAPLPATGVSNVFLPAVVSLILAATVLETRDPTAHRTHSGLLTATTLLGTFVLILVLGVLHPAFSLVPLAVAAVIGARTYRAVPEAFTLVPGKVDDDIAGAETPTEKAGAVALDRRGRSWVDLTVLRAMATGEVRGLIVLPQGNTMLAAMAIPMLFFWGWLISGAIVGEEMWVMMFLITPYLILSFLAGPTTRLHFFDPLPISRGRLFALLVLPSIAILAAGYGVGAIAGRDPSRPLVEYTTAHSDLFPPYPLDTAMVRVPLEYCGIAWDGKPPRIDSPWGESQEPWEGRLYKGSRGLAYSPFSTPEGSSLEFVALQISRAVETVYGTSVSPEEISERYLSVDAEGNVVPRLSGGLTILADFPGLRANRVRVFPFVFSGTGVLFFLMLSIYLRSFRATVSDGRRRGVLFTVLFTVLGIHLAYFIASVTLTRPWVISGVLQVWMRRATELTAGGPLVAWVVCALLFLSGYWFALSRFRRIEIPLPPTTS